MFRHQFGQNLILRLDLPFQMGDAFLFGLMVGPSSLLKSRGSVLEELLLPAVEHGWLEPQLVNRSEIGTASTKCLLRMATFSSGV